MENHRLKRWIKNKANFLRAVRLLGGKCCECGESHIATLDFHHLDPNQKEFTVALLLRTNDWVKIENELKKCKLVCSNCHRKTHFDANLYEQHRVEIEQRADGITPLREIKLRRWSDDEIKLLTEIYAQGACWEYIGRKLSRTACVIKRKIEELIAAGEIKKVKRKGQRKNPKFVDKTEILRLWDAGNNVTTISSLLEVSPSPIYRILREEGKV